MTDYVQRVLKLPVTDVSATPMVRDPVLDGAGSGVRFLFDLDFSYCYPGGAFTGRPAAGSPTSGQAIYDIAERANGSYLRQGATAVATYAGGGFDLSPVTDRPFGVRGPTDAWNSIHADTNRYFLWVGYYRMPTSGDWKASNGNFGMLEHPTLDGTYITQVEPLTVFQITPTASNPRLTVRRQIIVGASAANGSIMELTPDANYFGKMCQVAFWRNAAGQGFRMKSALAETSATLAVGTETALNFSGLGPVWGNSPVGANGPMTTEDKAASNLRVYRGWLENLNTSGRDPLTVLNADWARIQARVAASAAANSGASIIFV